MNFFIMFIKSIWISIMGPFVVSEEFFIFLINWIDEKTNAVTFLKYIKGVVLVPLEKYVDFIKKAETHILWGILPFFMIFALYEWAHVYIVLMTWDNWFIEKGKLVILFNNTMLLGITLTIATKLSILSVVRKIWKAIKRKLFKIRFKKDLDYGFVKPLTIHFFSKSIELKMLYIDRRLIGVFLYWFILFPFKWAVSKPKYAIKKAYKEAKMEVMDGVSLKLLKSVSYLSIVLVVFYVAFNTFIDIRGYIVGKGLCIYRDLNNF